MKKFLAASVAFLSIAGAASAQPQEIISNPRGMMSTFEIAGLSALLTEMGAVWEQRQAPNGQPYIQASVGGALVLNLIPTACLGAGFSNCVGLHTMALFSGGALNYQTVTAFNQKYVFTTAGIVENGEDAYLGRYDIADYGIPRGNVAASIVNFVVLAGRFNDELATAGKTVSLEGYADDMSSRLLNTRALTTFAGDDAVDPLTRHEIALEETAEMVELLLSDKDATRNKIRNLTVKP